jgi:hypothetical protein
MSGDRIVALLGIFMALFLVSQSGAMRSMDWDRRIKLGAIWFGIFAVLAIVANALMKA